MSVSSLILRMQEAGLPFECDVPLAGHTTFRIGGPCDLYFAPRSVFSLQRGIRMAKEEAVPLFFLGNGSNLLISDAGYRGMIVSTEAMTDIILLDETHIEAEAGASLSALCRFAAEHSLSGLEFAFGIPGSVGGAVYMNAGAYGGEIGDVLYSCISMHPSGALRVFENGACDFGYRHSRFTSSEDCILSAVFELQKGNREEIEAKMREMIQRRKEKQPLEYPSAGSTFKRPQGNFAGTLIEHCGLKGYRIGGAQVSEKHAGFLINAGNATCKEMLALIRHVQYTVEKETGYHLECEVKLLGEEE